MGSMALRAVLLDAQVIWVLPQKGARGDALLTRGADLRRHHARSADQHRAPRVRQFVHGLTEGPL